MTIFNGIHRSNSLPILFMSCVMTLSIFVLPSVVTGRQLKWEGGEGVWDDTAKWGGELPSGKKTAVMIDGNSKVGFGGRDVTINDLEVGVRHNDNVLFIVESGKLFIKNELRLGEFSSGYGKFVMRSGSLFVSNLYVGAANLGNGSDRNCKGELEVSGGDLAARNLSLAWGDGSEASMHIIGSRADNLIILDTFAIGAAARGKIGSTSKIVFEIDGGGVTPITIWNKKSVFDLTTGGNKNKRLLKILLREVPPGGDIVLINSARQIRGAFDDLPEGSAIRTEFEGKIYEWKITYKGGDDKCDIVLTAGHVITADGKEIPLAGGSIKKTVEETVISAVMERIRRQIESEEKPLAKGKFAFPGAEGFGAYAKGGRGGQTLFVTNLDDSGLGSLRAAIETKGPRTIIFRVGGVIELKQPLKITEPYLTVAGQTAPGDGICIKGRVYIRETNDIIIRYLRVRPGQQEESDCIDIYDVENFILDHVSATWGNDETISVTGFSDQYTIQWCLMAECLNYYNHAYGSLAGGERGTWHHNLYAHNISRNPRFVKEVSCDFRNNVIYNWGHTSAYGEFFKVNYVNNYLKPGTSTTQNPPRLHIGETVVLPHTLFLSGNIMEGNDRVSSDNWLATGFGTEVKAEAAFPFPSVATQPAEQAYQLVLKQVGAVLPKRDAVDMRIINDVKNHTGKLINTQEEVGGWPAYASGIAPSDMDNDGMPDEWEMKYSLNPKDSADGNQDADNDGYTNMEEYLNGTNPGSAD